MKVSIAQTAKYDSHYNKHTHIVEHCAKNIKFNDFDIPESTEIHIRPIKQSSSRGGTTFGRANYNKIRVEIECRTRNIWQIVDTIAHELTHIEQFYKGRLDWDFRDNVWLWKNASFRVSRSQEEYWNEPWEVEARERSKKFVQSNFMKIEEIEREIRIGLAIPFSQRINKRK